MTEQELAAEMYLSRSSLVKRYVMDWKSIKFWSSFIVKVSK